MDTSDPRRADVVREALTWLGTPYHHHGRIKGAGVDCLMLLCEVYARCGLVPPVDPGSYAHDWHLHRSEELYARGLMDYASRVEARPPAPGDIVLFKFGRTFSHGGVVVDAGANLRGALIVHSYLGRGVVATRLAEDPLAGRPMQLWSL